MVEWTGVLSLVSLPWQYLSVNLGASEEALKGLYMFGWSMFYSLSEKSITSFLHNILSVLMAID